MSEKNLREIIKELINSARQELTPDQASDLLVTLSSYYSNLSSEMVKFEGQYINVQVNLMNDDDKLSVAKAELFAKNTIEYKNYKDAKELRQSMDVIIGTLKYRLRVLEGEENASRTS